MTPEELKEKWHSLDDDTKRGMRSGGSSEPPFYRDPMVDKVTSGRVISARDRLMANYRKMFAVVAPVGVLTAMPLFRLLPWWAVSLIMLFFVIAAMMDIYLYRGIRSIDLWADGVEEVARKARFYRRRHHLFQLLLIPYAAGIGDHILSVLRGGGHEMGAYRGADFRPWSGVDPLSEDDARLQAYAVTMLSCAIDYYADFA